MSVAAGTLVHTLQGTVPVERLLAQRDPVLGFTWDGTKITVGRFRVTSVGTRPSTRLVLDNGTVLVVSLDQEVVGRDTLQPVSLGEIGLPVLPLYLGKTTLGYPTYKQQGEAWRDAVAPCDRRRVRLVARMVYEWMEKRPIETGMLVRYLDRNSENCHPTNLKLEGKPKKGRLRGTLKAHLAAHAAIVKATKQLASATGATVPPTPPPPSIEPPKRKKKGGRNHKIMLYEPGRTEEMFDLVGDGCSNLAVGEIFCVVTDGSA